MILSQIVMLPILVITLAFLGSVLGNGELVVFHSPPSLKFIGSKPLPSDLVPDIVSAALGFSTAADSSWPGLVQLSPFGSARLAVVLALDGPAARLPSETTSRAPSEARYALTPKPGQNPQTWWTDIKHAVQQRQMLNASATLLQLDEDKGNVEELKDGMDIGTLDVTVEEDRAWLREMQSLRTLMQQVTAGQMCLEGSGPSVLWLESSALHALSDLHGPASSQAQDAGRLLGSVIAGLNEELQTMCKDRILLMAVTSDASHTRKTRSLLQAGAPKQDLRLELNLSKAYDKNYPVMFNIFLFFGIGFVFALIAISIAIGTMDPGRDSIIYRMTNTRMKKDN